MTHLKIQSLAATTLIAVYALSEAGRALAGSPPNAAQLQTATTHPMKYFISLPPGWSKDKTWPVLVAPNAHYIAQPKTIELFAPLRDARKLPLIIVAPLVINADPVVNMREYRGAVMDSIKAADDAPEAEGRDEVARAKFDSGGIIAVLKDVRELYHGEGKVYITGFSSSTHIAYMFVFAYPELIKGAVINSGVYLGRGVDESHIQFLNSPERAGLNVLYLIGAKDPGYEKCLPNWRSVKTKLLGYGHPAEGLQEEVIQVGNAEGLGTGHNWFPTKILGFCAAVESRSRK